MAKTEKIGNMQIIDNKEDKFFCFPMISMPCTGSGYERILVEHIYGGFSFIKTSKLVTFGRINAKCDHFLCLFE